MYSLICRRCGTRYQTANSTIGFCSACMLTNSIEQQQQEQQWREQENRIYVDTDDGEPQPQIYYHQSWWDIHKDQVISIIGVPIILYIFYKVFF